MKPRLIPTPSPFGIFAFGFMLGAIFTGFWSAIAAIAFSALRG
jgi:hypothetical protein